VTARTRLLGELAPAAACALAVFGVRGFGWDLGAFFWFNGLSAHTGDALWQNVTIFGDALVVLVLLLPWIRRRPELVWCVLVANLLSTVMVDPLKSWIRAPRPPGVLPEAALHVIGPALGARSFPSGHTATAFAVAGVIVLLGRGGAFRWLALVGAAAVGVSRMAVGVHWPSDVLAGAAVGWVAAVAGVRASRWVPWGESRQALRLWGVLLVGAALVQVLLYETGYPDSVLLQRALGLGCLFLGGWELRRLYAEGGWLPGGWAVGRLRAKEPKS
jgi:membrane-associated phospholipid phosphatase